MKKPDYVAFGLVAFIVAMFMIVPIFTGDVVDKLMEIGEPILLVVIAIAIWKTGDTFSKGARVLVSTICVLFVFGYPISQVLLLRRVDVEIINSGTRIGSATTPNRNISDRYMVWGKEPDGYKESFVNVDAMNPWLKWNSSDIQGQLQVGGHYKIYVTGLRIPLLSWYRNILWVSEIVSEPEHPIGKTGQDTPAN